MTAGRTAAGLALFDLDGTLVDSAPDIADALDAALVGCGHDALGESAVRTLIGHGAARLVHRALTGSPDGVADADAFEPVLDAFLRHYAERLCVRTRPYDGIPAALADLAGAGLLLGCITNKPARFARPLLEATGLAARFALVLGGDSLPARKPDPAPLLHACRTLGVAPDRTVMVGDSRADLDAARAARTAAVCVTWGYAEAASLAGADALVESAGALPGTLARVTGGAVR